MVRALALGGGQVAFAAHDVTTGDGSLPSRWCDAGNPYNEKALLLRALENGVYVATSDVTGPEVGVVAADLDLEKADRRLALRFAPHRYLVAVDDSAAAAGER